MKRLLIIGCLVLISNFGFSQGLNNNYKVDSEDLTNVFNAQGIHLFKYPFRLKTGEYMSISYEVYDYGKLKEKGRFIEDCEKNGLRFNHHWARTDGTKKDTLLWDRFCFITKKNKIEAHEYLPGLSLINIFKIPKLAEGDFNSGVDLSDTLSNKTLIVYYYGIYKNSKNYKKHEGFLVCSTGMLKDRLIREFDYVILFFAERVSAEKAERILKEKDGFQNVLFP